MLVELAVFFSLNAMCAFKISAHFADKSISENENIKRIKTAEKNQSLINELKVNGESIYAVIACSGEGIRSNLFPTEQPILFGRIIVEESKMCGLIRGILHNVPVGNGGDFNGNSSAHSGHSHMLQTTGSVPEYAKLKSDFGTVIAEDLEKAYYEGDRTDECSLSPKNAHPILKKLGIKTNLNAYCYDFNKHWYEEHQKTYIFAEISRKENGFKINKPKQGPFFVTTQTPQALIKQATERLMIARSHARFCFVLQ